MFNNILTGWISAFQLQYRLKRPWI